MLKDKIMDTLRNMGHTNLVCVWNEYCVSADYYEDRIYFMDELDDLFCGCSATQLLRALDSDFSLIDDYFKETIFGLSSFDDLTDYIDFDDLADYIAENETDFGNHDLHEILSEEED